MTLLDELYNEGRIVGVEIAFVRVGIDDVECQVLCVHKLFRVLGIGHRVGNKGWEREGRRMLTLLVWNKIALRLRRPLEG
jgi:hypothetical protein